MTGKRGQIMTAEVQVNQPVQEIKTNDKEFNFRQQQAKYEKQLSEERAAREQERAHKEELEKELQRMKSQSNEEDEDAEPYVDHKKLSKKLAKFGEIQEKNTETKIQKAVYSALQEERKQSWIQNNPDFYEVLEKHAEKLATKSPKLAESILRMPDTFERQQLVYNNIKAMELDRPEAKNPSIQEKIDANRRSPYYQPTGVAAAPYQSAGDFSPVGQKNAYDKMQELKARLRI
jgi:hypothetical protein